MRSTTKSAQIFSCWKKQHELHVATEPKVQFDILWYVDNCYIAVLSLSHGGHQLLVLISCLIWWMIVFNECDINSLNLFLNTRVEVSVILEKTSNDTAWGEIMTSCSVVWLCTGTVCCRMHGPLVAYLCSLLFHPLPIHLLLAKMVSPVSVRCMVCVATATETLATQHLCLYIP